MLMLLAIAIQAAHGSSAHSAQVQSQPRGTFVSGGTPPAPLPPPPFTPAVEARAVELQSRVTAAFNRCDLPRSVATARYVEAMGTAAHSAEWSKAQVAMEGELKACEPLQQEQRAQLDFFVALVATGSPHDATIGQQSLAGLRGQLQATEAHYVDEAYRLRDLITYGRGINKDGTHPDHH